MFGLLNVCGNINVAGLTAFRKLVALEPSQCFPWYVNPVFLHNRIPKAL